MRVSLFTFMLKLSLSQAIRPEEGVGDPSLKISITNCSKKEEQEAKK